ncbi:hypothetical protein OsI_06512 [Oryza sativa Indica Group]|uniref:Uncharacterized protein n=1 Tax=Oryza sativa subsp. indica TaxID=39946 RepID=A2X2U7_ORYSI|nr:hypothetical protein OsI_06512 [Oryza sativa Indica Group]
MTYNEKDYDKMLWYILNNTPEVEPFIEICRTELESAGNVDVDRALSKEFAGWFNKHLATRKFVHGEEVNEDLYALASEPHLRVHLFSGCLVNGVRYHTLDRERSRKTQNSGVMVEGSHNGEDIDLYEHELSYQDDEQENTSFQVADLERASINEQPSNYEDGICVQASLVDQIRRERELEVEENGFEDDADETVRQYDSENEGPIHDDGEYSDFE